MLLLALQPTLWDLLELVRLPCSTLSPIVLPLSTRLPFPEILFLTTRFPLFRILSLAMLHMWCKTMCSSLTSLWWKHWLSQLVLSLQHLRLNRIKTLSESLLSLVSSTLETVRLDLFIVKSSLVVSVSVPPSVSSLFQTPVVLCWTSLLPVSTHSKLDLSVSYCTILRDKKERPLSQPFTPHLQKRFISSTGWSWWRTGSRCFRGTQKSQWTTSGRWASSTCQRGATLPTTLWRCSTSSTPSRPTT